MVCRASENKPAVPTEHQCVPDVRGCGTALALIVKIAASSRWCFAVTHVYWALFTVFFFHTVYVYVFRRFPPPPTKAVVWSWGGLCALKPGCRSTVWCVQKTTGEYFPLQCKAVLVMLKGALSGPLGCILINHLTTTWILLTLHWFQ